MGCSSTRPPASGSVPSPSSELSSYVVRTARQFEKADRSAEATSFVTVHSVPVSDGPTLIALAAFSYAPAGRPLEILAWRDDRWSVMASLDPPDSPSSGGKLLLLPGAMVEAADVTGDGRPDFLVHLLGGDTTFGAVVSSDGGAWRYIPLRGPYPTDSVLGRDPRFRDNSLVSDFNDCTPSCAGGHVSEVGWTYQASVGQFWAPNPAGWRPDPMAYNSQISPAGSTSIQLGFGGTEAFCATSGLSGSVVYAPSGDMVTMTVDVAGLPPGAGVTINWLNNQIRGYEIAAVDADFSGRAQESTLRMFRPGESRGYRLQFATEAGTSRILGWLDPCPTQTPSNLVDALTTVHPTISVSPSGPYRNGQSVRVRVAGFGVAGKVWLSECGGGVAPTDLGCGPGFASQALVMTRSDRTGNGEFVIHDPSPTAPNQVSMAPCQPTCTLLATAGLGYGYATTPIRVKD